VAGELRRGRRGRFVAPAAAVVALLVVAAVVAVVLAGRGSPHRSRGGGPGPVSRSPGFATAQQIASLSTTSPAAQRAKAVADGVRDGHYQGGGDSATVDMLDVENRVGSIALTTALWWRRTGDDSYLDPLRKFILASPRTFDPQAQSLPQFRALGGLLAAVGILSAAGEWDRSATLPNYQDVTWDEFMQGGGSAYQKPLPLRSLSGVGRVQWRTIHGAAVDSASNWGAVARFAYVMWAVCEGNNRAIDESARLLQKWLGSSGSGEADFNTTAAYRSSWNNWASRGAPDGSGQKLVAGIGKSDPAQPGLDGVVIEDVARGQHGYDAGARHYGATGLGLTYPLETADAVWATAGVLTNLGLHPDSWGEGGDGLTRMAAWLDRPGPGGGPSVFAAGQQAYSIYRNHPWLAQRFSSRDVGPKLPTESAPDGLDRLTTFGDWLAAPSSTWGRGS